MNILKFNTRKSKAQAMVEFAIVLPILLLVVYGLIETGRLIFVLASVNNATRQAVRYGSTSGVGPNGVPRYQDCAGIREAAQKSDFLNAFEDADITITYDQPLMDNPATPSDESVPNPPDDHTCTGTVDTGVNRITGDRVIVTINSDFNAIFPKFLPFLSRTVTGGNPIVTTSARTLLLTIKIAPPLDPTVTLITAHTPDPSQIGEYVSVSVTVSGGSTTPSGTVAISGAEENCTITLSGGAGSCNIRFLSPGTKTITASYNGDSTHDVSGDMKSHTVNKAPTVTTITADTPDPSLAGDTVTVTVSVTSTYGTPTGTVTIGGADAPCTITLPSTSCNVTFAVNGKFALSATYSGDTEHAGSSDTYERHDVIPKGDTVTIITSHNPDPSEIGKSVTVYVTVGTIGPKTPSGTVTITGADTSCIITLNKGAGSCTVTFNSIGVKTLTATYTPDSGSSSLNGSSDSVSHSVELAATTTTITGHVKSPSNIGDPVIVTVAVTGGSTIPTGTVNITGADVNCSIILDTNGTGSCNVVFNSSGAKTLTAAYGGDVTHAASNDTETHVVSIPPIAGCNTVTYSLLQQTPNGALAITITNPLDVPLEIGSIFLRWNHDKGHTTGDDKTLRLQFVNIDGTVFWSGNDIGDSTTIISVPAVVLQPKSTSTITFAFHQIFDRWDNTELVQIHFSTPGCEVNDINQTQH